MNIHPKNIARKSSLYFLLLLLAIYPLNLNAQTCSCAGAPLLATQSGGASGAGSLLIGLTYEFNQITRLYNGTEKLQNDSAERSTQSTLLEASYGITDRLSVSGTISFVDKTRLSGLNSPSGTQSSGTQGIGDGMVQLRYVLVQQNLWNRYHLAVGGGVKAPFGNTSHRNDSGLLFNADMQSGTGSWDGVLWSQAAVSMLPHSTLNLSLSTSYRITGENQRFGPNDKYAFGNEFVSTLSVNNGITERLGYRLGMRYRSAGSDRLNNTQQVNTGGKWVFLIPEINYGISDNISAGISGSLPVYQYLKGTQPTTTFTVSASVFININSKKNTFKHGNSR